MSSNPFAAQILETSAAAYSRFAASLLLERRPELADRYSPNALGVWTVHLEQRVLELSAALGADEPKLFASRIRWALGALRVRDVDDGDLRSALLCLSEVLRDEMPEPGRESVATYLETAIEAFDEPPLEDLGLSPSSPRDRLALSYLEASLQGNSRHAIDLVVATLSEESTFEDSYEILLAAQREAGRMWHTGEIAILEEHLVTSTTERAMAVLAERIPRQAENGKTVIVSAVAHNTHGLAVRLLADFFEIAGWRTVCLGADVPAAELAKSVVYFEGDLLALSVTLTTQIKAVGQTIAAVRGLAENDTKIVLGGLAFTDAPELWRRLGADGSAPSASAAVKLAAKLVGLG